MMLLRVKKVDYCMCVNQIFEIRKWSYHMVIDISKTFFGAKCIQNMKSRLYYFVQLIFLS